MSRTCRGIVKKTAHHDHLGAKPVPAPAVVAATLAREAVEDFTAAASAEGVDLGDFTA